MFARYDRQGTGEVHLEDFVAEVKGRDHRPSPRNTVAGRAPQAPQRGAANPQHAANDRHTQHVSQFRATVLLCSELRSHLALFPAVYSK